MPLINFKVDLKLKRIMYYVFSAASGVDNANSNPNNFIFTNKDTKFYIPVVTLSAKDNKKLSKLLSKGSERSDCCNEYQITFLDSTKLKIAWRKITTFFKRHVSIILWYFSS